MRLLAKFFGAVVVCAVSLSAALPASARSYVPSDESRVVSMINKTRREKGLNALQTHSQLTAMARGQSDRMEDRGNIYHNPQLGAEATRRGLDWERVGENVGMGPNVDLIQQAFLDSPHHYENIVHSSYNHVGVGVTKGDDGKMYVTQVFADLKSAPAPAPKPAEPKPAPAVQPAPQPVAAAPAAATPTVAAQAPQQPKPAPQAAPPAPKPSADPNAVIGGLVADTELPDREQVLAAAAGPLERVIDALVFWA